jgi:WD40 repeat protein
MGGHAFISYVREDTAVVDRLQRALEEAGIDVWRDVDDIAPGSYWPDAVRAAIEGDGLAFVPCFSAAATAALAAGDSGQQAELEVAIEHHRQPRPGPPWLIPVRLDAGEVPPLALGDGDGDGDRDGDGDGQTLADLQWIDLSGAAWDAGCARLVAAVQAVLQPNLLPAEAWAWLPDQAIVRGAARGRRWPGGLPRRAGAVLGGNPGVNAVQPIPVGGGTLLAAAGFGAIRLWNPATGQPHSELPADPSALVHAACAVPVGARVLLATTGDAHQRICLWDAATGSRVGEPFGPTSDQLALCAVPVADGRVLLASGGHMSDPRVWLWDPVTRQQVCDPLAGHERLVTSLCAVPVGDRVLLASGSHDATVRLWDPVAGRRYEQGSWGRGARVEAGVYDLCAVPVGDRVLLAAACGDGRARLWDAVGGWPYGEPLWGHQGVVLACCALPVGERVLLATAGHGGVVRLWDPATGTAVGEPLGGHGGWVTSLAAVPVGPRLVLASGSHDGTVRLWEPAGAAPAASPERVAPDPVLDRWARAAEGDVGDGGEGVRAWPDALPQREAVVIRSGNNLVSALCAVPLDDGRVVLASGSHDHTVRFWDPVSGQPHGEGIEAHVGWVGSLVTVEVAGRRLVASADAVVGASARAGRILLWDPVTATPGTRPIVVDSVSSMCTVPVGDGRQLLAAGDISGRVALWDPATGQARGAIDAPGWLADLCVVPVPGVPGGVALATISRDGTIRLWDVATGEPTGPRFRDRSGWRRHRPDVWCACALRSGGRVLLATGDDRAAIRLWDVATGRLVDRPLIGHTESVTCLCPVPIGERVLLASGSWDETVRLWDPATGRSVGQPLRGHGDAVRSIAVVPLRATTLLATADDDGRIRLWGPGSPEPVPPESSSVVPGIGRTFSRRLQAEVEQQDGRAHLRGDILTWLARFGQHKAFDVPGWDEVGATVAALHRVWSPQPAAFVEHLATITVPIGGWAVYGAHRIIDEIITDAPVEEHREAIVRLAVPFARRQGIALVPWELDLASNLGLLGPP